MGIKNFFNQTTTIENRTGRGVHNEQVYSAATTVLGRVEKTRKTIATPEREREPIDLIVFYPADTTVEVGDRINYSGTKYKVMTKEEVVVGSGEVHHLEIMAQTWRT